MSCSRRRCRGAWPRGSLREHKRWLLRRRSILRRLRSSARAWRFIRQDLLNRHRWPPPQRHRSGLPNSSSNISSICKYSHSHNSDTHSRSFSRRNCKRKRRNAVSLDVSSRRSRPSKGAHKRQQAQTRASLTLVSDSFRSSSSRDFKTSLTTHRAKPQSKSSKKLPVRPLTKSTSKRRLQAASASVQLRLRSLGPQHSTPSLNRQRRGLPQALQTA